MAKKIKVSRKSIKKPDEFLTLSDRFFQYVAENRTTVLGIAGVVVVVLLGVNLAVYSLKTRQAKADQLLTEALSILQTPLADEMSREQVLKGAKSFATGEVRNQEALGKLTEVVKKFGNSEPGLEARFHLGAIYYNNHDFTNSISSFEAFIKALKSRPQYEPDLEYSAYLGIARSYLALQDFAKADEYYQKILEAKKPTPYHAEAMLGSGRALAQLAKNDQAKEKFNAVVSTYPGSIYQQLAELELANLGKPKPETKAAPVAEPKAAPKEEELKTPPKPEDKSGAGASEPPKTEAKPGAKDEAPQKQPVKASPKTKAPAGAKGKAKSK
jgi:tetratricopeptide (TPR) repeat protein